MRATKPKRTSGAPRTLTARTIRFPEALRGRVAADAERCGRSFEAHVLALLRSHYGEDVDIAPPAAAVLQLALRSANGIPAADWEDIVRPLGQPSRR